MPRTHTLIALVVALPPAWAGPTTDTYGDPLPLGAVQRLGRSPYHGFSPHAVQFAADGKSVVVLRSGVYVSVYDRETGRRKDSWTLPTDPVGEFRLLPGGEMAYLVQRPWPDDGRRDSRFEIWDLRARRRLGRVFANTSYRGWMVPAPDGSFLIQAGEAQSDDPVGAGWKLTKWEVRTGEIVKATSTALADGPDRYGVNQPQVSPDGRFMTQSFRPADANEFVVLCWETAGLTECWRQRLSWPVSFLRTGEAVVLGKTPAGLDLKTGRPTATRLPPNLPWGSCVQVGPDPDLLVYSEGAADGGQARTWNLKTGAPTPGVPAVRLADPWPQFQLSRDGATLIEFGKDVQVYDRATGRALWPAAAPARHVGGIERLVFSSDGRRLASVGQDRTARVWELRTGRCFGPWPAGTSFWLGEWIGENSTLHGYKPPPLALSADGRRVVVGSHPVGVGNSGPRIYDVDSGDLVAAAPIPRDRDPDGQQPLLGDVAFTPRGDAVAATFNSGVMDRSAWTVARWDYSRADWTVGGTVSVGPGAGEAFDGPASLVAAGRVLVPGTGRAAFELTGGGGPVVRSGNGRFAAGPGNADPVPPPNRRQYPVWREIHVWDARTGAVVASAPRLPEPLPDRMRGVDAFWIWPRVFAVHPTGRYLALADAGGVRLWDAATRRVVHRFPFRELPALEWQWQFGSPATALAFSPDGSRLATGLPDGTILLWEVPVPGPVSLPPESADRLWAEMMGEDTAAGWRAAWLLGDDPAAAVRLARRHVAPVEPFPADELRRLLVDVESPRFAVRERATARLERAADLIGPAVAEVLKATRSEETRVRLAKVMAAVPCPEQPLPAWAGALGRAVSVVEHAGGDDAQLLLIAWAGGVPDAFLTREAKAALERLAAKR
jgi:WD40 repeat protein